MWDTHSLGSPADVTVKMASVLEVGLTRDISRYRAKLGGKSTAGRGWHPVGDKAKYFPCREQEHQVLVTFDLVFHPPWPRPFFDIVSQPSSLFMVMAKVKIVTSLTAKHLRKCNGLPWKCQDLSGESPVCGSRVQHRFHLDTYREPVVAL